MLDIKLIRQNPDLVRAAIKKRNYRFDFEAFLELDQKRRSLQQATEELSAKQNLIDKEIQGLLKAKQDPKAKIEESRAIKKEAISLQAQFSELDKQFKSQADRIPNIPHSSLPVGGPQANEIIKEVGQKPRFSFKPLDHIALAENLDLIDFKRAAKVSGSNFVIFKGLGARLERALIDFMIDLHAGKHGYSEIIPPKLVNRASMRATGQLPNLEEDMYSFPEDNLFLIPTAEVPLTNLHRDEILDEKDLPVKYVAYTPCFRREAGSYGKDTRGLVRVHEFDKVELVKFVKPENSYPELEVLLLEACKILDLLKLSYRINLLATGDISFAAAKCYDIELYTPGIDKWLEVSSCSNFEDFQARRGNIRYRDKKTAKLEFVHTLNGSGLALPRLVVAILENYQQKDGSIVVPKVLRSYYGRRKRIQK
ncbi:MAG: serine--tRNA ligase [Candidatus Omnitrophica bacterium]|nr:serine--tRNA ligase [Candidatus Omnitrophota bacterium]MBU2044157.1 serine--tRNA ligase [Candidatus Omnitrophota bacterium]MBU2266413.1 serine--tRNA ligase [Candidatus Omnitrophota bacterium]